MIFIGGISVIDDGMHDNRDNGFVMNHPVSVSHFYFTIGGMIIETTAL